MSLSAGARLGNYEILGPLGQGGMGEVYRAKDTKLGREVAIKVLPAAFAQHPERLARFEREAKVLASLNHPNIAIIHAVEESSEGMALVMELVQGETLKGPVPLEAALKIAAQIASALEAAHEKGIIHRDLKPANIMITPAGVVKVLDFGLAAVIQPTGGGSGDPTDSPTLTMAATQAGTIMGTAGYMSPEQAAGQPVDARADIWAFGVVLWEMLAGKRLFVGDTVAHTLAAVLTKEPDWESTPAKVRLLLRCCLQKEPGKRLQAIGDWRVALEAGTQETAPSRSRLGWSGRWGWVCAGIATLAALSLAFIHFRENPVERPLASLDVDLGADAALPAPAAGGSGIAISADGTRLAYLSGNSGKLFTRRLDQPKALELPGTEGANGPFFSPDGQWLGFSARGKLKKISVEGGAVIALCDVPNFAGASWGEDGNIILSNALTTGLLRIPPEGGAPETLAPLGKGELALGRPQILPGGKAVLFTTLTTPNSDTANIEVLTLADRRRKIVSRGGTHARYLPTSDRAGHLVYLNKATLFAIPFDLEKLETRGTAVPMVDDVAYETQTRTAQYDFSRTGTLVYRRGSGSSSNLMTMQWVDPAGEREPLRAKPGLYANPSLSPDGKRVAQTLVSNEGGRDVWVYDTQRDAMTRLTFGGGPYFNPTWSPDGQYVVFGSFSKGISWTRADGASQPEVLTPQSGVPQLIPSSFAPDGKRLVFSEGVAKRQIWGVTLENQGGQWKAGKQEQFLKSNSDDINPAFSHDGRWLAYQSTESGSNEVYVRAFPPPASGQGGKWQISNNGGTTPRWSGSGHELLYQSGDQILSASYVVKGDSFVAEKPNVWIAKLGGTDWDLSPDGKRVLVLAPVESSEAPKQEHEVVFLENFFDELRRRVPAK